MPTKTFWDWDWFWYEENKKDRKSEWEPTSLELPLDDPTMITPPTTSSRDNDVGASEENDGTDANVVFEL